MDLFQKLGLSVLSWEDGVKSFNEDEKEKRVKECLLKDGEYSMVIELKPISEMTTENHFRLYYFLTNASQNFLKLKHLVKREDKSYFFAYEKEGLPLVEYMSANELSIEKRLYLYKCALEIVYALITYTEDFTEFEQNLFFVAEKPEESGVSKEKFLVLKMIYHAGFAKSTPSKDKTISANYFYWLFYLFFLIFKDYSKLPKESNTYNEVYYPAGIFSEDLKILSELLYDIVSSKTPTEITIEALVNFYNKILAKTKIEEILMNFNKNNNGGSTTGINPLGGGSTMNNYNSMNSTMNNMNPTMNTVNRGYSAMQNPMINVNNNFNNSQINYNQYFQFYNSNPYFQNANFSFLNERSKMNLMPDANMLMHLYMTTYNNPYNMGFLDSGNMGGIGVIPNTGATGYLNQSQVPGLNTNSTNNNMKNIQNNQNSFYLKDKQSYNKEDLFPVDNFNMFNDKFAPKFDPRLMSKMNMTNMKTGSHSSKDIYNMGIHNLPKTASNYTNTNNNYNANVNLSNTTVKKKSQSSSNVYSNTTLFNPNTEVICQQDHVTKNPVILINVSKKAIFPYFNKKTYPPTTTNNNKNLYSSSDVSESDSIYSENTSNNNTFLRRKIKRNSATDSLYEEKCLSSNNENSSNKKKLRPYMGVTAGKTKEMNKERDMVNNNPMLKEYSNKSEIQSKVTLSYNAFDEKELEMINRIDNPRRKKLKNQEDKEKFFHSEKNAQLKEALAKFLPIFNEELENCLLEHSHKFMKVNFPQMYNLENFYLYVKLNKERKVNKIGSILQSEVDIKKELIDCESNVIEPETDKEKVNISYYKVWDCNRLENTEVDKYLSSIEKIWPIDKYVWCQETALAYLASKDYKVDETIQLIEARTKEFEIFLSNKNLNTEQYKKNLDLLMINTESGKYSKRLQYK